ncbi:rhodanese-like domain-containing protein [Desulfurivibrio alkaliphilus]|nr:rhodanese-like domain-containing protein [Desulfurivibrio alkaliphilus]MDF1614331.1 rhodanese-like domain-containing protein [Desulfurivibrio alkaliphilus]
MQRLRNQVAQLGVLLLAAFLLTACGTAGKTATPEAAGPQHVAQDPQLRITTAEVMALFDEVFDGQPLIKARTDANNRFLMVDARPLGRYQEGHIPGAIHMPPGEVAANIDKLPRDRKIIFYCGGLHCPLSTQAARIAMEHGLTNVKVYYEGDPAWLAAGNYLISKTPYVYHMVTAKADEANFTLIDTRPTDVHRKSFIPGSLSIPINQWDLKQSLLPRDLETRLIFYCGGYG